MGSRLARRIERVEMAAGIRHWRIRMIWKGDPLPDDLAEDERLLIVGWDDDESVGPRGGSQNRCAGDRERLDLSLDHTYARIVQPRAW